MEVMTSDRSEHGDLAHATHPIVLETSLTQLSFPVAISRRRRPRRGDGVLFSSVLALDGLIAVARLTKTPFEI